MSLAVPHRWRRSACRAMVAVAGLLTWAASPAPARAGDTAMAESLFESGKALMDQGRVDEACPKFAESMRIEPAVGSLLNLARCHELEGKSATAWTEYRQAAAMARGYGQPERAAGALSYAAALEKRLSRLTIEVRDPAPGLRVVRGGAEVGIDVWGVPVAVDPGRHTIEASAPGRLAWKRSLVVGDNADQQVVVVPTLAPADSSAPTDGTGTDRATTYFAVAGVATAVGIAALVVGVVYGARASSTWDEAQLSCPQPERSCDADGVTLSRQASDEATVSTAAVVVGAAAVAGAVILWVLGATSADGSDEQSSASVRVVPLAMPQVAGLGLWGEW